MKLSLLVGITSIVILSFGGCKPKPEVSTYTVPKEEAAPTAATSGQLPPSVPTEPANAQATGPAAPAPAGGMTALPGMAEQSQGFGDPTWTAPAGWVAQPLGSIRKGSWKISGENGGEADVSVTVFPGDVGGDLANVNRWRRQIGLNPVSQAQLSTEMAHLDVGDAHAHLVLLNGTQGQSVLGAMAPRGGGTWFFKMQGPTPIVQSQRSAFDQFLASVAFPQ